MTQFVFSGLKHETIRYSFLVSLVFTFGFICAQENSTTSAFVNNYTVIQKSAITEVSNKYREYNRKKDFEEGYRIQINYTDVREEAYQTKGALYKDFPDLPSYVDYEPPYYKVRVGDFRTRLEATYYLQQVVAGYSGAFIVKDKIKIK